MLREHQQRERLRGRTGHIEQPQGIRKGLPVCCVQIRNNPAGPRLLGEGGGDGVCPRNVRQSHRSS